MEMSKDDKLMEIAETVARIDQKTTGLQAAVQAHDTRTTEVLALHARKINSLEVSRGRVKGMAAGIGSLGVLSIIASWFKWG